MAYFIELTSGAGKQVLINLDNVLDFHAVGPGNHTRVVSISPAEKGHHTITVIQTLEQISDLIPGNMKPSA